MTRTARHDMHAFLPNDPNSVSTLDYSYSEQNMILSGTARSHMVPYDINLIRYDTMQNSMIRLRYSAMRYERLFAMRLRCGTMRFYAMRYDVELRRGGGRANLCDAIGGAEAVHGLEVALHEGDVRVVGGVAPRGDRLVGEHAVAEAHDEDAAGLEHPQRLRKHLLRPLQVLHAARTARRSRALRQGPRRGLLRPLAGHSRGARRVRGSMCGDGR